jgi:hypothetical protein
MTMARRADSRGDGTATAPAPGPPWKVSLTLAAAALGWYLLSGEAARFADVMGAAGVAIPGPQVPHLPVLTGPSTIAGVDPRPAVFGAAGLAALGGAVAGARWWGNRFRLRSRSTVELLADAARDPIRPLWAEVFDFGTVGFVYSPAGMGKTDFLLAAVAASIKAAVQGEPVRFCGREMHGARWLVVSEQTSASVESYLRAWGLHLGDALPYVRWITWEQARATWRRAARWQRLPKDEQLMPPWDWTAEMLQREASDQGCSAVLLDTYKQWAGDTSASENDTGGVRKAVVPLQALAEDGKRKAVLVSAHSSASLKLAGSESLKGLVGALTGMHKPDARRWPTVRELVMDKNRNRRAPDRIRVVRTEHPDGTCEYHEWTKDEGTKGVVRPGKIPEPAASGTGGFGGASAAPSVGEKEGVHKEVDTRTDGQTDAFEDALKAAGADGISTTELGTKTGLPRQRVGERLNRLATQGKAEKVGKQGKADKWRFIEEGGRLELEGNGR